jgi:hypothetical protein
MARTKTPIVSLEGFDTATRSEIRSLYQDKLLRQAAAADATIHTEAQGNVDKERSIPGFGGRVLSVPTMVAAKARLEGETFSDPAYRKHIAARYPGTEVRAGGTRIQSGWSRLFERNAPDFLRKAF